MIAEKRSYTFRWRSRFRRRPVCLSSLFGEWSGQESLKLKMDKICHAGPFRMTRPACEYIYRSNIDTCALQVDYKNTFWNDCVLGINVYFLFGYLNQSGKFLIKIETFHYTLHSLARVSPLDYIEITSWKARAYRIFTRVGVLSEIERVSAAKEWDF